MQFKPSYRVMDHIDVLPRWEALKDEKNFYQSSPKFVWDNGGPIARDFLDILYADGFEDTKWIIDQRVHHLQAGYYPAIPGYHLDWIPRKDKGTLPDLSVIPDYEHVVLIVGETSLTEFVAEPFETLVEYQTFEEYNDYIKKNKLGTWSVRNGDMVHFTSGDWHRPVEAQQTEWRMLIRASRVDHVKQPTNQIRNQSQVYIPIQEASW